MFHALEFHTHATCKDVKKEGCFLPRIPGGGILAGLEKINVCRTQSVLVKEGNGGTNTKMESHFPRR